MKGSHFAASLSEPKAPGDFFSSSSWLQGLLWGFIIFFNGWNFAGHAICKDLMSEVWKKGPEWFMYDMTNHCRVQGKGVGLQPGFRSCFCKWWRPQSEQNWTTRERANDGSKKSSFSWWLALKFDCYCYGLVMHVKGCISHLEKDLCCHQLAPLVLKCYILNLKKFDWTLDFVWSKVCVLTLQFGQLVWGASALIHSIVFGLWQLKSWTDELSGRCGTMKLMPAERNVLMH